MGRPFKVYCMSLVERLGYKSLNELYNTLDNNDILEWSAYDLTQNQEWQKKYNTEIDFDNQKNQTPEEEAKKIKLMFMKLGNKK
jgi:hypothetical protein